MSDHYEIWHAESKTNPQKCSVLERKSKMAADGIIFYVPRDRALVKPVGRFSRVIRQNACFVTRRCPFGFRMINISVFTPKIAKKPNFGAL